MKQNDDAGTTALRRDSIQAAERRDVRDTITCACQPPCALAIQVAAVINSNYIEQSREVGRDRCC